MATALTTTESPSHSFSKALTMNLVAGTQFSFSTKDFAPAISYAAEYVIENNKYIDDITDTRAWEKGNVERLKRYYGIVSLHYDSFYSKRSRRRRQSLQTKYYTPVGPYDLGAEFSLDVDNMVSSYSVGLLAEIGPDSYITFGMSERGILSLSMPLPFEVGNEGVNGTFSAKWNPWKMKLDYDFSLQMHSSSLYPESFEEIAPQFLS